MKEEANHLIEYHTVLKKAAMMIFGGEFGEEKRLSIDSSHVEMPEQQLANEPRGSHETEGSDDFLVDGRKCHHLVGWCKTFLLISSSFRRRREELE